MWMRILVNLTFSIIFLKTENTTTMPDKLKKNTISPTFLNQIQQILGLSVVSNNISVTDPEFPIGGVHLVERGTNSETKESGPSGRRAPAAPRDPPMYLNFYPLCGQIDKAS